jgi:lipopolysaccharide transport system permease protein
MQHNSSSPIAILRSFLQNRGLIVALTKREVLGRYRGSLLGILWSFFNPLFMLAVYTFIFSTVFKAKWGGGTGSKTEFAMLLFAGTLTFGLFSECLGKAPSLILANPNFVKKVVFPLEILAIVSLGSAIFHFLISLCVWLLFHLVFFGLPPATMLLLPIVLLPLCLIVLGFSWFLASLGVYLRDVGQIIGIFITALMFLSPIFYPISALPEAYQTIVKLSPVTIAVEELREVMFWGRFPNWTTWGLYFAASAIISTLGFAWFQKTRRGFADVM